MNFEDNGLRRRDALKILGSGVAVLAGGSSATLADPEDVASAPASTPATEVLTKKIPSSNEPLPVIGLGTWQTFDVGASEAERAPLREVLRAFVELGGKLIDSSPMYKRSEQVVGDLAGELKLRPRLFVATKVWIEGKDEGIEQMNSSMKKLRADPIDLMQVHNLLDVDAHLDTLREWKRQGRVRHVGVTHYTASAHEAVMRVMEAHPLDFVQIDYSVAERDAEKRLLPLAKDKGIAVIANRPFATGELLKRLSKRPVPDFAAEIDCDSWAQLLLKWVVSHPAVTCAIPATSKVDHLKDDMKAGRGRMPDDELRARIAAAAE